MAKENKPQYFTDNLFKDYLPNVSKRVDEYQKNKNSKIKNKVMLAIGLTMAAILLCYLAYEENIKRIKAGAMLFTPSFNIDTSGALTRVEKVKEIFAHDHSWFNYFYGAAEHNQEVIKLIDIRADKYIQDTVAPILFFYLEDFIQNNLHNFDQNEVLEAVKVYLMITELEPFKQKHVQEWYTRYLEYINTEINSSELQRIIDIITPKIFVNLQSKNLSKKLLSVFNNELISIIFSRMKNLLEHKPQINLKDLLSPELTKIFTAEIFNISIPYFYTANGYKEYLNYQTEVFKKFLKVGFFRQQINVSVTEQSIQEINSNYVNNYSTKWNEFFNLISIKRVDTLEDALNLLQAISTNYSLIFNFLEQLPNTIFIKPADNLLDEIKEVLPINLEKTKGNNIVAEAIENFVIFHPLKQESVPKIEAELTENIKELTGLVQSTLFATDIDEAAFHIIKKYENLKDTPLNKAEAFIASLPSGLIERIYSELIYNIKFLLYKHAYSYVNQTWESNIYEFYISNIKTKYPFAVEKYEDPVVLQDFIKLFKPNGVIDSFTAEHLNLQGINLNKEVIAFLNYAADIKNKWFSKEGKLQIKFSITPLRMDSNLQKITLLIAGKEVNFSTKEFNTYSFVWPPAVQDGEYIKIEFLSEDKKRTGLTYEGLWAWYRFLQFDYNDLSGIINNDLINKTIINTALGRFEFISKLELEDGLALLNSKHVIIPQQIVNIQDYSNEW
ncbi:ImcF-like family type VI secretion C-terminal domain protein (plasmid) [Candidatus Trichorickettsia mobilis]|uniref:ImcF-related family protein n=1 Tax=Candidatus Trichorickettsia mobilis TaxID=1346319 RepID=UPI002B25ACEE|nr:ImcF-related family protein [Candidatus Trichorickettsia mobilis]WPY01676.1 ImcF-like family type VI secretion C-terminal domain protein [Candidatus Trichorickettsia mobilis]